MKIQKTIAGFFVVALMAIDLSSYADETQNKRSKAAGYKADSTIFIEDQASNISPELHVLLNNSTPRYCRRRTVMSLFQSNLNS